MGKKHVLPILYFTMVLSRQLRFMISTQKGRKNHGAYTLILTAHIHSEKFLLMVKVSVFTSDFADSLSLPVMVLGLQSRTPKKQK